METEDHTGKTFDRLAFVFPSTCAILTCLREKMRCMFLHEIRALPCPMDAQTIEAVRRRPTTCVVRIPEECKDRSMGECLHSSRIYFFICMAIFYALCF